VSLARWSADSDVYVFEDAESGLFECCGCYLQRSGSVQASPVDMVMHMERHRRCGHQVPQSVFTELLREASASDEQDER
jgi:hypothetical protein